MSQTWKWPLILGGVSLVGLVAAILGDGLWDGLSWAALGWPVYVTATRMRAAQRE